MGYGREFIELVAGALLLLFGLLCRPRLFVSRDDLSVGEDRGKMSLQLGLVVACDLLSLASVFDLFRVLCHLPLKRATPRVAFAKIAHAKICARTRRAVGRFCLIELALRRCPLCLAILRFLRRVSRGLRRVGNITFRLFDGRLPNLVQGTERVRLRHTLSVARQTPMRPRDYAPHSCSVRTRIGLRSTCASIASQAARPAAMVVKYGMFASKVWRRSE